MIVAIGNATIERIRGKDNTGVITQNIFAGEKAMDYPTTFPLEEAKHVITAIRAGTVGSELATLAKDVWTIQGYAMSMLIGNPVSSQAVEVDPVAALEKVVASHENGATAQAVINWSQVAQWAANLLIQWLLMSPSK